MSWNVHFPWNAHWLLSALIKAQSILYCCFCLCLHPFVYLLHSSICGVRLTCILPLSYQQKMIQCSALSLPGNENRFLMHGDCLLEVQFCFAQYIMSYNTVYGLNASADFICNRISTFYHKDRPKWMFIKSVQGIQWHYKENKVEKVHGHVNKSNRS